MYFFSQRSLQNLKGVHQDLVDLMIQAIQSSPYDFVITEGRRSPNRQALLYQEGKSKTLRSAHLTGKAVDLAILVQGIIVWEYSYYLAVANHIKKIAKQRKIEIIWGGDWKHFVDACHFQLV